MVSLFLWPGGSEAGPTPVAAVPMQKQLAALGLILRCMLDLSFLPPPSVAHYMAQPSGYGSGVAGLDG